EQRPCSRSAAGPVSTPWQPRPQMHPQWLRRKVTSNTHVRSSFPSSNETHSWAWSSSGGIRLDARGSELPWRAMDAALVADLERVLASDRVRVSPLELELYARDASIISGRAEVVCFPLTTEEVQACVRVCRAHGRSFVPRGSGTGLAGGAVPV